MTRSIEVSEFFESLSSAPKETVAQLLLRDISEPPVQEGELIWGMDIRSIRSRPPQITNDRNERTEDVHNVVEAEVLITIYIPMKLERLQDMTVENLKSYLQ